MGIHIGVIYVLNHIAKSIMKRRKEKEKKNRYESK
jgi:hypothetical protein